MKIHPPKGIIFDMDGTLIASTEADYLAWKKVFAHYGRDLSPEQYFPLLGKKSSEVIQSELQLEGAAQAEALQKKTSYFIEAIATTGIRIIPFAEAFLKRILSCNIKLALATSSRRERVLFVLELTNLLPYFQVMVTGDEVIRGKPFPETFLKAAHKLGLPPEACIVIEDAGNGVEAAKNANMKCIAITTTHTAKDLSKADLIINSYEEIEFDC